MSEEVEPAVEGLVHKALHQRTTRPAGSLFLPPDVSQSSSHGHIEDSIWTSIAEDPPVHLCEYRSPADDRERLDVTNQGDFYDWLSENIGVSRTLPGLFCRGGSLVRVPRIGEEGWIPPLPGDDDGPAQVRPLTETGLMGIIQSKYWVCRQKEEVKADADSSTGEAKFIYRTHAVVPKDICKVPVDAPDEFPALPRIHGITHTPMLREDGSLLRTEGYDPDSGLLYLPDPGFEILKTFPTGYVPESWVEWSRDQLNLMFDDFPFEHPLYKMNLYALLLTPLMRAVCPPPYPMFVISAHQRGTGKSLLARVARELHGGVHRPELPTDSEEIRKQITSILTTTTAPIINFDNITQPIRNGQIANLLTSNVWSDRPLGRTANVEAPNDRIWVATGNNIRIGGDLDRRIRNIQIDSGVADPEFRTDFAFSDLVGYVQGQRGTIISMLLTQLMWWVQRGKPIRESRSDSYAHWEGALAEILEGGGLDPTGAFAAGQRAVAGGGSLSVNEDEDELAALLEVLLGLFAGATFQIKDIKARYETLAGYELINEVMPIECEAARGDKFKSLGIYLSKNVKRPAGGYRLVQLHKGRGGWIYQLETVKSVRAAAT